MKNDKKYPSGEEVRQFLTDFCFEVSANIPFDRLVHEASKIWEINTGWEPFLALTKISSRTFNIQSRFKRFPSDRTRFVDFKGGLIQLHKIENNRGETLELGRDYHLLPESLDSPLEGHQWLELTSNSLASQQVTITGIWGATEKVPSVVWGAILRKAAAEALACLSCTKEARVESWSEGGVTEHYKVHPFNELIKRWEENFRHVVGLYKRLPSLL